MARGDDDPTTDPPDYQAELWMIRFNDWRGRNWWKRTKLVVGFACWFVSTRGAWKFTRAALARQECFNRYIWPTLVKHLKKKQPRTLH